MYTLRNFPCYTELFKSIILSKYLHKILSSSCTRLYFSVFLYQGVMTGLLFIVVVQLFSRVWLCNPIDCSMPGFPVLHYFPEFTQTHVHWIDDAIQPSHPLSLASPLQSFPASGSFPVSQLFLSRGQSIETSASASVLPMNIQGWLPLGLISLISLLSKGFFKSLLQHHSLKASVLWHSAFFMFQLSHPFMTTGKNIALSMQTFVGKVMSLLFTLLLV